MKKISLFAAFLYLTLSGLPLKTLALTPSASFIVSGATYTPGATFNVPIYETSGSASVTVVQADVIYDPTQLKVTGTDFSDSDFSGGLKNSDNGSMLSIVRYVVSGVSNQAKIGTITFQDIGSATSTAITYASSSHIYSSGKDIWDGNTTGATFNFAAPTPTPVTTPGPQPVPLTKPSKKTAPQTAPAPAATANINSVNSAAVYHAIAPPIRASNEPWEAIIVAAILIILALLVRLFNLHNRIRTRVQNRRHQKGKNPKKVFRKR